MTDQSNIFESMKPNAETNTQQQQQAPSDQEANPTQTKEGSVDVNAVFADQLAAIRTEEGSPKYKTVQDALDALRASQEHIKRIEQENAQYKTMELKDRTAKQLLEELDSKKGNTGDNQNGIDLEAIKGIVQNTLSETEQKKAVLENQKAVSSALTGSYGEKAEQVYVAKAAELGMSVQDLDYLAAKSPKAVLAYFNSGTRDYSTSKNATSSINTESFNSSQTQTNPNIMFGASSKQVMDLWREAADSVQAEQQY